MTAWLIYTKAEAKRNEFLIGEYFKYAENHNINLKLLISEGISFGIKNGENLVSYNGENLEKPDFAICRVPFLLFSEHMEKMGIPVFNSSRVSKIANDKREAHIYLSECGVRCVDTYYFDREYMSFSDIYEYPLVIKSAVGHGGSDVFLAHDFDTAKQIVEKMPSNKMLFQKCAKDIGKDLRVYVIGKEILLPVLRSSDRDFRSNFCLGGSASVYQMNEKERKTVERIISLFDFGFVGIDFIFENGEMLFNEIEDVVGARMIYSLTDIDIVAKYMDFIIKSIEKKSI